MTYTDTATFKTYLPSVDFHPTELFKLENLFPLMPLVSSGAIGDQKSKGSSHFTEVQPSLSYANQARDWAHQLNEKYSVGRIGGTLLGGLAGGAVGVILREYSVFGVGALLGLSALMCLGGSLFLDNHCEPKQPPHFFAIVGVSSCLLLGFITLSSLDPFFQILLLELTESLLLGLMVGGMTGSYLGPLILEWGAEKAGSLLDCIHSAFA